MLPNIRDDLQLLPGPPLENGFPTWTLYDPVRHRFYRIGWAEFELLARWHLNDAEQVVARVHQETTLGPGPGDIEALKRFLSDNCLLEPRDPDILNHLKAKSVRDKGGVFTWLLRHYLFIRIPLSHPDRFFGCHTAGRTDICEPSVSLASDCRGISEFFSDNPPVGCVHPYLLIFLLHERRLSVCPDSLLCQNAS